MNVFPTFIAALAGAEMIRLFMALYLLLILESDFIFSQVLLALANTDKFYGLFIHPKKIDEVRSHHVEDNDL